MYFCSMTKSIILPHCKSLLIRQMVLQYVYTGEVMAVSPDECSDVQVTRCALEAVCKATGSATTTVIDVADCGAAYRFLMALLSVTPGHWLLTGTPRLLERPIEELVEVLSGIGADIQRVSDGWLITGKDLQADTLTVNCACSSQFASALLLISPIIGLKTLHIVPADAGSLSYVRMTLACLKDRVEVPLVPSVPDNLGLSGDWSAAVFWYAMALLHPEEEYELVGLSLPSIQGDAVVAEWFASLGVTSIATHCGMRVRRSRRISATARKFDMTDCPDLVPVMTALACLLPADFTFFHTQNLQYKESNRIKALHEQLQPFADVFDIMEDGFRVKGKLQSDWPSSLCSFHTYSDHRLAMAFLLFGQDVQLDDITCLRKSYPALITHLQMFSE